MINETTSNLGLPLPHPDNTLEDDVVRLRSALTGIDTEFAKKGLANGYASLDSGGKVPSAQLPSYVDDAIEVANFAALPATGETGKIYVTIDTGKIYRWSGSAYVWISPSPGSTDDVPEGSTNLYFTAARAKAAVGALFEDVIIGPGLTAGETVLTVTGGYTAGKVDVYMNGALLFGDGDDYTASNGTSITLTVGVGTTDKFRVRRWLY